MGNKNKKYFKNSKTKRQYRVGASVMWKHKHTTVKNKSPISPARETGDVAEAPTVKHKHATVTATNNTTDTNNCINPATETTEVAEAPTAKTIEEKLIGRRIINVSHFFEQLQHISTHGPFNCGLSLIDIISESRNGLVSTLTLKCKMCNEIFRIKYDKAVEEMDLNTSAVAGTISIGCGYSQLTELSATIGLAPMSKSVFSTKMDFINKNWEAALQTSMKEAAEEERRIAIEENRVNSEGIPIIDVIADGCYSKRSYKKNYSSLSGAATIIGKRSNKILFLAVRNKYCCICASAQNKNITAKDHICYKNYSGASTGMESEILVEGFKNSIEMHNIIYGRLISDGDANTYAKILEARPYKNYTVEKVECRNHLLRNFCNKMAAISSDTKYTLKYRKYITKKRILSTRKVVVEAIKNYKNSGDIKGLHEDIVVAPNHAFGRHDKCKEYFCSNLEEDHNIEQEMFTNSIGQRVRLITSQLAAHARSLILDVDSNSVERYHSIVAKFVGGKRVNYCKKYQYQMRCNAAAVSFNTGKHLSILQNAMVGKTTENEIKKFEDNREKSRLREQKYQKKKRRAFEKQDGRNYGEDCTKPDMEKDMLEESKKVFLSGLIKSSEEIERICKETVLQSGCSEWLELRRNLLTASNFGRVIKRRKDTSCQNMVKDILYKNSIAHVSSVKHGTDNEKVALAQLSQQENVEIQPCGLYIDPDVPYLGATPDGTVDNDTIVEVKCPITSFNIGVERAVDDKKIPFYKKNKDGILTINKDHCWFYQIQGQLHVTRKNKCIFGIWSGNNFAIKIERIERDDDFWLNRMEKKLKDFYLDCLLPELVDPRYPRKMTIRDPEYITKAIEQKKMQQTQKRKNNETNNGEKTKRQKK